MVGRYASSVRPDVGVVLFAVFAATPVFFGLFMVTEPRTAPTAR